MCDCEDCEDIRKEYGSMEAFHAYAGAGRTADEEE